MSTTSLGNQNCEQNALLEVMDSYLDNELAGDAQSTIADHRDMEIVPASWKLAGRFATGCGAPRGASPPPQIFKPRFSNLFGRTGNQAYPPTPIALSSHPAAALIICLSAAVSYRLGYPPAPQEGYRTSHCLHFHAHRRNHESRIWRSRALRRVSSLPAAASNPPSNGPRHGSVQGPNADHREADPRRLPSGDGASMPLSMAADRAPHAPARSPPWFL